MATIFDLLLQDTTGDVQVWSLPNVSGEGVERWIGTRSPARIDSFVQKRDQAGRATYFCVAALEAGQRRRKEYARELPFLFCDVDFKDIDLPEEQILDILLSLPVPPSRIHHSGNGLHCFWYLDSPFLTDGMDVAEVLLRRIAHVLGADRQVCHCVALLRVPGSHNSKNDTWKEVRVIKDGVERYTPAQIRDWLDNQHQPVIRRRSASINPFVGLADDQEIRVPLDVPAALADMGPGTIHNTQLRCLASLWAAGVDEDAATALVLDATRQLPDTGTWNWDREEKTIREMYRDAVVKYGSEGRARRLDQAAPGVSSPVRDAAGSDENEDDAGNEAEPSPEGVINLSDARAKRQEEREAKKQDALDKISKKLKNEHVVIGNRILTVLETQGHRLMYVRGQAHMYAAGLWTALTQDEERTWASIMVEQACTAAKIVSSTKIVNEVRAWLQRQPALHDDDVEWDDHGGVALSNGILDPATGEIKPLRPEHHATRTIDCEYDPAAPCDTWLTMLATDYRLDTGTQEFFQEWLGTCLLSDRPRILRRALCLIGPSNCGKSNVINVFAGLLSKEHNATPIERLENAHGLMPFLKPHPWVLHEAFDQGRWEVSATTKALLSGDGVSVNVKNGPMIELLFKQAVIWGSNVSPQFREASRAMENRLAIVHMRKTFDPLAPPEGTAKLAMECGYDSPAEYVLGNEMAGLLNWAIEGLKRVQARGHFVFTAETQEAIHTMRVDSNMAMGFFEACCEFNTQAYVTIGDLYGSFKIWHQDNRGGPTPSADAFGKSLAHIDPDRLYRGRWRVAGRPQRTWAGLAMSEEGLAYWDGFAASSRASETGLVLSTRREEVNRPILEQEMLAGAPDQDGMQGSSPGDEDAPQSS